MASTRYSNNSDPAHAPERNLSSARLRPINISLAVAAQACRTYPKEARESCLWLANLAANSQRIQLCWQRRRLPDPLGTVGRISEADICEKLGLHPIEVYRALTGHDEADLDKFCLAIKRLRSQFESALPPLVKTADSRTIAEAFSVAGDEHEITIVQGKWQHGKTEESERNWLLNLHDTIWLYCPGDNFDRTFLNELARALGIGANNSKKTPVLQQQIKNALGIGLVSRIVIDEAHKLWPKDLVTAKPFRIDFVRELRDTLGVGFVLLDTEQGALALELAKQHNQRYAPGQFAGRRYQYELRDAHTDREIDAIVKLHAGSVTDDSVALFREFAKSEEGYLGVMVKAIQAARKLAGSDVAPITGTHAAVAIRQQQTSDRVKSLAVAAKPVRRGRFKLLAA